MQRTQAIKILKYIAYAGIYGGLLMPLMFLPVVIFPFVFSKLIFFQVIIGLTFPAYLILAWVEPQYRPRKSFLYFAFIAYFVALFLSMVFAIDPLRAWWGNQERMNGLFTLLHFFVWLTMATAILKTWKQWQYVLNYLIVLGVFMGIVALLQKPFPNLLKFPATIRVGGLLDNPIYQGAYQLFILFFIAMLWFKTKRNALRAWYVIAAIVSFSAMIAAGSRGPFMGLIFGGVISAIAVGVMYKNTKVRVALFGSIGLAALVYIGIVTAGVNTATFKSLEASYPTATRIFSLKTGTAGRFIAWDIAWQSFLERPLTGYGLDNFHIAFNKHYNPQSLRSGYYETWFDRAHNTVMDVVSMTGLFGALTFLGIWFGIYYTVIYARRKRYIDIPTTAVLLGLPAGYFLQNLFVFDHPAAFSMSYLLYALVICVGFSAFKDGETDSHTGKKPVPWVTFAVVQSAFILLVYLASVVPFRTSMMVIDANEAFAKGDVTAMMNLVQKIKTKQTPYLDEQSFLYSRNLINLANSGNLDKWPDWRSFYNETVEVSEKRLESHSRDAHGLFIYSSMLASVGSRTQDPQILAKAEEKYRMAIELSPKRQQLYFGLAELLKATGRTDEALQEYLKAASFDEEIGEPWWYVGVTYLFNKNQPETAAEYLRRAVTVKYPQTLRNAQDALIVSQAYVILEDKENMQELILLLPTLPASQPQTYVQIAKSAESLDLIAERDLIINAVSQMDPATKATLEPLLNGDVETIDEALEITNAQAKTTAPAPTKPVVTKDAELATATQESAPVPAYSGPRR
ncbi:MAG: O-antigen ligase family protein [Patescibacteria group bacterium]|nr:O-antigen ligase family protein [Patescibacteria group bacterium]